MSNVFSLKEATESLRKTLEARQLPGLLAVGMNEKDQVIVVHVEGHAGHFLLSGEASSGYYGYGVRVIRNQV